MKFNNKDGLLKNFMTNFLRQFNNPTRFGLYKVAAQGVEKSVETLKTMLPERENPKVKAELKKSAVRFEDFLPKQQKTTAIPEDKVDWKQLETIGVTKERLEESEQLEKLLNWQKSDLVTIAVKAGSETIYTDARLLFARMKMAKSVSLSTTSERSQSWTTPTWDTNSLMKKKRHFRLQATLVRW